MAEWPPIVRFLVLAVATICSTIVLSNMNIYNFTKICAEPYTQDTSHGNFTKLEADYVGVQKPLLKAASAIGALAAGFPYTYLYHRFAGRYVFLSAGIISVVSTALVPLTHTLGFGYFFAARIIQGVSFSTTFQVIGCVTSDWAALGEHGIFLAFLTGCTQLSNIFTMPIAAALCASSSGWPAVYYVHAGVTFVSFALWFIVYRDSPSMHSAVSSNELKKISAGKAEKDPNNRESVPILSIITDKAILGVWLAAFSDLLLVQLVSQYGPVYFNDYLKFNVMNSGIMSAVPIIAQFVMKMIAGFSSDALTCVSNTVNVKIMNTIALVPSGACLIILSFFPRQNTVLCVVGITVAVSFTGFVTAGFNKCATLRSRQHSSFVMTQIMNLWAISILVEPFIVDAILTDHESSSQWMIVFIGHGAFAIFGNLVYLFVADARPAPWTNSAPDPSHGQKEVRVESASESSTVPLKSTPSQTEYGTEYSQRL